MYKSSKFVSKFEVVKCTKLWKFNLKLCTNVLIILIWWKFQNCWMNKIVKTQWKIKEHTKSLSSTCSIVNIIVVMVDSSPPKLMLKLSMDALHPENGALQRVAYLCIHVSVDGYFWSRLNSVELLSSTCRIVYYFWSFSRMLVETLFP